MADASPSFLGGLRERARARPAALAFPEGTEPRVHRAVAEALGEALFEPVLIGDPAEVRAGLALAGADPDRVRVVDPEDRRHRERCERALRDVRRASGASLEGVSELAADPLAQAAALVHDGAVDGAVAGSVRTTAEVVRAALTGVGLAEGRDTLSSAFFMVFEPGHRVGPSVLTFTDAGVVPHPTAEQLAEIAVCGAAAHAAVTGERPRVAFLSYSTKGSAGGEGVELVREALDRFRALQPDVPADGELQGDAALVPEVARSKAPGSSVAGRANVLVFPDLASANVAYKLVQHLGGAHALGPILQGLARPFNDLSRGASVSDIVAVACITALMAAPPPAPRPGS